MLNVTVQLSRIAVLAILIAQGDSAFAQHCKDGSCCLKSRQGSGPVSAPTPRRSPSLDLGGSQRFDGLGDDGLGGDGRGLTRPGDAGYSGLPSDRLTQQGRYQARPTGYTSRRSAASTVPVWELDVQKGAAMAREAGRPMLIRFTADWCGYCRKMKSEVFSQPGIQRDLARAFVTVELDADKNRELVQRLGIKSLPTTIILTPDMQIAERMEGYRSAEQLQVKLNRFLPRAELQREITVALR